MKRRSKKRGSITVLAAVAAVLVLVGATVFVVYQWRYAPSKEVMSLSDYFGPMDESDCAILLNGEYLSPEEGGAFGLIEEGSLFLRLDFLREQLDSHYVLDETAGQLRYTTDREIYALEAGQGGYLRDDERLEEDRILFRKEDGSFWLDADFAMTLTDFSVAFFSDPNRAVLWTAGTYRETAQTAKETAARRYGGVKSPVLTTLPAGVEVSVLESYDGWELVLTTDGVRGCVPDSVLTGHETGQVPSRLPERSFDHNLLEETVCAGWHQVLSYGANSGVSALLDTTPVNVIIPTWFLLRDNEGAYESYAEAAYVSACHSRGVQVWGLVGNIEYAVDLEAVLNSAENRDRLIDGVLSEAQACGLDGLNIDIESLPSAAGDGFLEFLRELSVRCHRAGLILSVDNYPPSAHTEVYGRKEQASYADYHVLMAYDEHWSGGEAGSVSSAGYVRNSVSDLLLSTPAEQIILGLPFYTRIWTTDADGDTYSENLFISGENNHLSSIGKSWDDAEWLSEEQQYYIEYEDGSGTHRIWLEEQASLTAKIGAATQNRLAGVSFWRLGQEPANLWTTITQALSSGEDTP